jgi:small nuclear ribonucleoprotein (snRNP)-like protein
MKTTTPESLHALLRNATQRKNKVTVHMVSGDEYTGKIIEVDPDYIRMTVEVSTTSVPNVMVLIREAFEAVEGI